MDSHLPWVNSGVKETWDVSSQNCSVSRSNGPAIFEMVKLCVLHGDNTTKKLR